MSIDIYDKGFQSWLKGVLGLNTTRTALCAYISWKIEDYVQDIPQSDLKQFFCCLKENNIAQLEKRRQGVKKWKCKHDRCRNLMNRFLDKHTEKNSLKYIWKRLKLSGSINYCNVGNEEQDITWNVIILYMHIGRNGSADNFKSLDCLDISHVIKVMKNCKLFDPDESEKMNELRDLYDEVIQSRNKLMHSSNNKANEDETQSILKGERNLLDCLNISEETYYKEAIQNLYDLEERDFVIKYHSEEYEQVLAEVLEAKDMAENLYKYIGDDNKDSKTHSIELQHKLEKICGLESSRKNGLEMKPTKYKSFVKKTLEKKQEIIGMDKTKCDVESEHYKELLELEQNIEREIEEIKVVMQKSESEEMAEIIDSLNKKVEILEEENQQTEVEGARLQERAEELNKEIGNLTRNVKSMEQEKRRIEKEVERYKLENETLKASTSISNKSGNDSPFQKNIDIIQIVSGHEKDGNAFTSYTQEHKKTVENIEGNDQVKRCMMENEAVGKENKNNHRERYFNDSIHKGLLLDHKTIGEDQRFSDSNEENEEDEEDDENEKDEMFEKGRDFSFQRDSERQKKIKRKKGEKNWNLGKSQKQKKMPH